MWIKNILSALNKPRDIILEVKSGDNVRPRIVTVDLFASEPWLSPVVEEAINKLSMPWGCHQEKLDEAKKIALQSIFSGTTDKAYAGTLSPSIFKTKRDAQRAMGKIKACGWAAVDRYRAQNLGLEKYSWNYMGELCDFLEHKTYDGKTFTYSQGAQDDYPGKNYGCACWASPVIDAK